MADKQELKKVCVEATKEMIQKTFGENLFALMTAKKITQKDMKKTNEQVILNSSSLYHLALLQQRLTCHNAY